MILGAGSSIPEGMPSVASLDNLIRAWSAEWSAEHRLPNYFERVLEAIETYYERASPSIRPTPNFEKVLGDMIGLAHWMTPSPLGNALREIIAPTTEPLGLVFPHGPYGATVTVNDQLTYLLMHLARHMRGLCRSTDLTGQTTFQSYKRLLDGFRGTFDVGIYNLNYDTVALAAWPEGFTGFAPKGAFDAEAVHRRSEWGFIYHLHGSVHHSLVGVFGDAVRWEANLASQFFDGHQGLATDHRSNNRSFPKTTLIAGGFKLDQLLVEPFQTFYASLVRHVYEADAILIGGYGFGDTHVNRALQNRLQSPGSRPPVMVLTWPPSVDPMDFRQDAWSHALTIALCAPTGYRAPGFPSAPPIIPELVQLDGFEVSAQHRVAIWHGGYVEAEARLESVIPWLAETVDDTVLRPKVGQV